MHLIRSWISQSSLATLLRNFLPTQCVKRCRITCRNAFSEFMLLISHWKKAGKPRQPSKESFWAMKVELLTRSGWLLPVSPTIKLFSTMSRAVSLIQTLKCITQVRFCFCCEKSGWFGKGTIEVREPHGRSCEEISEL